MDQSFEVLCKFIVRLTYILHRGHLTVVDNEVVGKVDLRAARSTVKLALLFTRVHAHSRCARNVILIAIEDVDNAKRVFVVLD
jgi:hypothetical protein